jgi:hypothetical protein
MIEFTNEQCNRLAALKTTHFCSHPYDAGESFRRTASFKRSEVEDIVGPLLLVEDDGRQCFFKQADEEGLVGFLTGWEANYRGPGLLFWHDPVVQVTKRHVIIRQSGGYDV